MDAARELVARGIDTDPAWAGETERAAVLVVQPDAVAHPAERVDDVGIDARIDFG